MSSITAASCLNACFLKNKMSTGRQSHDYCVYLHVLLQLFCPAQKVCPPAAWFKVISLFAIPIIEIITGIWGLIIVMCLPVSHPKWWCLLQPSFKMWRTKSQRTLPVQSLPRTLGLSLFYLLPSIPSLVYMSADTAVEPEIQVISFTGFKGQALCIGGEGCRWMGKTNHLINNISD